MAFNGKKKKKNTISNNIFNMPTSMVMDGMAGNRNNDFQFDFLTNQKKAEERKRKINIILRNILEDLERENEALKKENEELKKINNNNE